MDGYKIHAEDHLQRAIALALQGGVDKLLYAGLEIRLGTESRHAEYADGWEHIPAKVKREYSTTKVGKALDRAFRVGDRVLQLTFHFDGRDPFSWHYTPVSLQLRKTCEQLGNYLHANKWSDGYSADRDTWHEGLETLVRDGIAHLGLSLMGQLLGPALTQTSGGKRQVVLKSSFIKGDDEMEWMLGAKGVKHVMEVEYVSVEKCVAPLLKLTEDNFAGLRNVQADKPVRDELIRLCWPAA